MPPTAIDELDRKIVNELLADSRASFREISKKLGTTTATVIKRVKRLKEEGVIREYTATLDYAKMDYDIHVLIQMRISKGKLFQMEKKIATHPHVTNVYDVTGENDAVIFARFKSTREMDRFLKEIQTYDFVERTRTSLILNTIKEKPMRL